MSLPDLLDTTDQQMRDLKEAWVADNPDQPELAIYIYAWRGDDLVACVQTALDGNKAIQAASMAAVGFNVTVISVSFESWVTSLENSPLTGKPWRPGEMNFVARTHPDAFEKGWLNEQLATVMHDREDNFLMSKQHFTVEGRTVNWHDREVTDMATPRGDRHPLAEVMAEPTMLDRISEAAVDDELIQLVVDSVDEEARLFHCDAATIRAMEEKGLASSVMLFADKGSERQKMIDERAGELGLKSEGPVGAEHPLNTLQQAFRDHFHGADK